MKKENRTFEAIFVDLGERFNTVIVMALRSGAHRDSYSRGTQTKEIGTWFWRYVEFFEDHKQMNQLHMKFWSVCLWSGACYGMTCQLSRSPKTLRSRVGVCASGKNKELLMKGYREG